MMKHKIHFMILYVLSALPSVPLLCLSPPQVLYWQSWFCASMLSLCLPQGLCIYVSCSPSLCLFWANSLIFKSVFKFILIRECSCI